MIKNTQGLVLRNIKYGETSIISTLYTKDFGIQAYIIQGARSNRKTGIKANYFQIGQFLDITVYHKPGKNLQYIKEVKLNAHQAIQSQNIIKQSIAQFCCELVLRCIKEEEENVELYDFLADFFLQIKTLKKERLAIAPIHFAISFAAKIGFAIRNNYSEKEQYFDAMNGEFCHDTSHNIYTTNLDSSVLIWACLTKKEMIESSQEVRVDTLNALLLFLKLQIEQMGEMKSVAILHQILHG